MSHDSQDENDQGLLEPSYRSAIGAAASEYATEEDRLWEEEKANSVADALAQEHARQARVREDSLSLIERTYNSFCPKGYSNRWKTEAIADFVARKNLPDDASRQKALRLMSIQAQKSVPTRGLSELDRVFMALKRGALR